MLKAVGNNVVQVEPVDTSTAISDHHSLLDRYIKSYAVRNLAESTTKKEHWFLTRWFEGQGPDYRPLYTWEALDGINGRQIIHNYIKALLTSEIRTHTLRQYMGILRRYFDYVLEHPILINQVKGIRITDRYDVRLEQPISEFDIPRYVYEGERLGVPLDPKRLYDFYSLLRDHYLSIQKGKLAKYRNYTMAVLAGESGLRADELTHLEIDKDLFFSSNKLQTRYGKAAKGSGKRARITLFTPLAQDTVKYYIKHVRLQILKSQPSSYLFVSESGHCLSYALIQRALTQMIKVAKQHGFGVMDHMSWHWFRRIFATRFIERFPGKQSVLINLLGHMSPNTVHRYIRHSEAWMDEQIQSALKGM